MTKNGSLELRVRVTKAFFPLFLLIATPQGRIRVFLAPSWLYVSVWELIDSYKHGIFLNFSLSVHCGIRKMLKNAGWCCKQSTATEPDQDGRLAMLISNRSLGAGVYKWGR